MRPQAKKEVTGRQQFKVVSLSQDLNLKKENNSMFKDAPDSPTLWTIIHREGLTRLFKDLQSTMVLF